MSLPVPLKAPALAPPAGLLHGWDTAAWTPEALSRDYGDVIVPVELGQGDADYRDAFITRGPGRRFVAGEPMPLRVFMEQFYAQRCACCSVQCAHTPATHTTGTPRVHRHQRRTSTASAQARTPAQPALPES